MINIVAQETNINKEQVSATLNSFFTNIKEHMIVDEQIVLDGLGQFKMIERPERLIKSFQTGELVQVPKSKIVKINIIVDEIMDSQHTCSCIYESLQNYYIMLSF